MLRERHFPQTPQNHRTGRITDLDRESCDMSMSGEKRLALEAIPEPDLIFSFFKALGAPFVYRCKPYEKRSMGCNNRDREVEDHGAMYVGRMSDEMSNVFRKYNVGNIKTSTPRKHKNFSYSVTLDRDDALDIEQQLRLKMKDTKHQGETIADFVARGGTWEPLPYWDNDLNKQFLQPFAKMKPFNAYGV